MTQLNSPVHGLIFLFKYIQDDEPAGSVVRDNRLQSIFFAKQVSDALRVRDKFDSNKKENKKIKSILFLMFQVINNACATQAILSILLNCGHSDMKLGATLAELKEFCQMFDAHNKGLTLSNAAKIRTVHNSFARQTLFELDNKKAGKDEDVFHFIGYVPIDGRLYELDGLKEGPIDLGAVPAGEDWVNIVRPIIQKRIDKYSEGEIHFNLMAIVSDRQMVYQQQIEAILNSTGDNDMDTDDKQDEIARLRGLIEDDVAKKKQYKVSIFGFFGIFGFQSNAFGLFDVSFMFNFRSKISVENTIISH